MTSVFPQGIARVRHADTGESYEIRPDELDWIEMGSDERQMGVEINYVAEIDHPELGTLSWELSEYPAGVENDRAVDVGRHTLLQNFSFSLGQSSSEVNDEVYEEFRHKVDALVEWFHERYEDPAHRTPYETAEGGYQWIWGGPYDAKDVLSDHFPEEEEELIEAAIEEIEADGVVDWAPTPSHGHFNADDGEHLRADRENSDNEPDDDRPDAELEAALLEALEKVPGQIAGPKFEVDFAGRVELTGWRDDQQTASLAFTLGPEIREASEDLIASLEGTNAHRDLLDEARRYFAAVASDGLTAEHLYARGVRLENLNFVLISDVASGDRPPLPSGARAALESVLQLHAATIMTNPEGARLVAAASEYRRSPTDMANAKSAAQGLSNAVQEAAILVGPAARAAVEEAASTLGSGPNPERSTQVSMSVLSGLVAAIAKLSSQATSGIIGKFAWDALKGTAFVSVAVHATTTVIDQALSFLLDQAPNLQVLTAILCPDLQWMNLLANGLASIRRRIQAHRSKV